MIIRDGDFELVSYDYVTGRSVWRMYDGEKYVFRTDYPVEATMAENEAVRNVAQKAWAGDWHRIASVPLNVYFDELADATKQDDNAFLSRWLNNSDNAAWRTKEGRV